MLASISMENFRSYRHVTFIDFRKTNYKLLKNTNIAPNGLLKGALFVGANASGKSNIIEAVKLLLDLLFKDETVAARPWFCFFTDRMEFVLEFEFIISDATIKYMISRDEAKRSFHEQLRLNDELVLERIGTSAWSMLDGKKRSFGTDEVDQDTLFLRTVFFNTGFAGQPILQTWFAFLRNSFYINPVESQRTRSYAARTLSVQEYLDDKGTTEINQFFKKHQFRQSIEYASEVEVGEVTFSTRSKAEKMPFFRRDELDFTIPYSEESLGNRKLLTLLPSFLAVIQKPGLLLLDEFSSGFHNALEELLIRSFMRSCESSQMLLVSHSTNLLSNALLRPDQIYTVTFDGSSGSSIKRLSDEQPRAAQNLEKMYLSGVFEGIPDYDSED